MLKPVFAVCLCVALFGCKAEEKSGSKADNVVDARIVIDPNSYA
jgi:hypothetical protein